MKKRLSRSQRQYGCFGQEKIFYPYPKRLRKIMTAPACLQSEISTWVLLNVQQDCYPINCSILLLPCEMASPESCCGAGFATVSDIGRHYNTAYGQSIPHVELCVVKGQMIKK